MLVRLLLGGLRPYRRDVTLVLALLLGVAVSNLYLPNLTADIINNGVVKGDVGYIWRTGAAMLVITLLVSVLQVISVYFAARVAMGMGRDWRAGIFERVQSFSAQEMNHFGAASLITRNTNDVQQVQMFMVIALTVLASAPMMAVGGVIMALYENAQLSLLLLVVIPAMAGVIGGLLYFAVPLFRSVQAKIDRINQVLREQITGVRVIRAFVRARYESERFETANEDLTQTTLKVTRIFTLAMPSIMIILNLSSVAVIWFGGHLVDSGKSTVVNLLARFFDATAGAVLLDSVDVREQSLSSIWESLGLVPQQAYLFAGSIRSNLLLGRAQATEAELWRALEVAQAADFVKAMPKGLDEPVAQGGTTVSGGQRQRLAIARALVKRPQLYVFDDCFSALDAGTDARLRAALRREVADATVLIVSQRVSTIRHADCILVLDEGTLVGSGTHDELLATNATYQEIVDSQLRGAEAVA